MGGIFLFFQKKIFFVLEKPCLLSKINESLINLNMRKNYRLGLSTEDAFAGACSAPSIFTTMSLFTLIFGGAENKKFLRTARDAIVKINDLELEFQSLDESALPQKIADLKQAIASGANPDDIMPRAFALVKNAARRLLGREIEVCGLPVKWDMVHFDVQLIAGIALWKNMVAEVSTGEGKTLIATLPAVMNALYGKGCHIATVNEYLARRDSQWMGALYNMLGLSCGCVYSQQSPSEKKKAYLADITYGTSSEFGFDFLRDNSMTSSIDEKVQRGFFYALVDEADSILIDEARTPLIISGEDDDGDSDPFTPVIAPIESIVKAQNKLCSDLMAEFKKALLSGEPSESDWQKLYQVYSGAPRNKALVQCLQNSEVRARLEALKKQYCADCNKIEAHRLKSELYYVVSELSKSASFTEKGQDFLARFRNSFTISNVDDQIAKVRESRMPEQDKLAEIARLRADFAESSLKVFALNTLLQAYALYEKNVDYLVKNGKVEIIDQNTGRVLEGRRWENGLHQAVEAKERVGIESENTTYATIGLQNFFKLYPNLAGMTATAMTQADEFREIYGMKAVKIPTNKPCIREELPDLIYLTRREKYNAIERQIRIANAKGQPVLAVTPSVEESEVLSRMLKMRGIKHAKLNAVNDEQEARIIALAGQRGAVTISTNMAGRGTDIKLGEGVEELGGLLVIGTEHNPCKRVDRQLIGRSARQGDRGQSRFIVSMEDSLFRLYADTSRLKKSMAKKHIDGVAFEHPAFKSIIDAAQEKAEGYNFEARKDLLKLDLPMNQHRKIVYAMRDEILSTDDPLRLISQTLRKDFTELVRKNLGYGPIDSEAAQTADFYAAISPIFGFKTPSGIMGSSTAEEALDKLCGMADEALGNPAFTDRRFCRSLMLYFIDKAFRDHLSRLDYLREAIYLRSYGQRDPFQEFAFEAYNSFAEFNNSYNRGLATAVFSAIGASDGGSSTPTVSISTPKVRRRQGR